MANIFVNLGKKGSIVENKIFGHFCEHAFGNINGGFYDPKSKYSDGNGYRSDVISSVSQVKPRIMRYPGGNFVSNYHWENGVGPRNERPRVFEYAWLTEEDNQFGTVDFINICKQVGAEPYICVNMGTGTVEEAMNWVEYCNGTGNTKYANLRRSHGYSEPFNVKYWGLGNEAYGSWQMNHMSSEDYAKKAFEFAKAMKWVDSEIKLIACGYEQLADWNYTVVKYLWELIDYISAHHYSVGWGPFNDDNYNEIMSISNYMEKLNELTKASILTGLNDIENKIKIAWDEWNVFGWLVKDVNEDSNYTLKHAIATASILSMFIRNSDSIGMANYSTFVNINGAVSTNENGIVSRPQYHVFDLLSNNIGKFLYQSDVVGKTSKVIIAKSDKLGRSMKNINLDGDDQTNKNVFCMPHIEATVTGNDEGVVYVSLINKHQEDDVDVNIFFNNESSPIREANAKTIYHEDINACNTVNHPDCVTIKNAALPELVDGYFAFKAKKHSINHLEFLIDRELY